VLGAIKLGNAFGIPVRIHWTFMALPILLLGAGWRPLQALLLLLVLFGCVLLHELGHSLMARGFGIRVLDITFWPLGGIARMNEIPESPRIEGLVAIAGPAVNFALCGLSALVVLVQSALPLPGAELVWAFLGLNLIQGGSNLLPAFPMDGGRLLRAFLARRRTWLEATEIAVKVSRVLATLLFLGSIAVMILSPSSVCLMPLIAVFLWLAGTRELLSVRLRHGAAPFGGAWPQAGSGGSPPAAEPEEPGSARRPLTWEGLPGRPGQGFSDDLLRRIESYRGRLRRPPPE
jgi:stage IV sporulation protein FB